jgi:hypothetical protein
MHQNENREEAERGTGDFQDQECVGNAEVREKCSAEM